MVLSGCTKLFDGFSAIYQYQYIMYLYSHLLSVLIVFFIAHWQPLNKVNAALDNLTSFLKFEQVEI